MELTMSVFAVASSIEGIIQFRDYMFNFDKAVKCQEENWDLKQFLDATDNFLRSDKHPDEK